MAFKGQWVAFRGIVNCSKGKCNIYCYLSCDFNSRESKTKTAFGTTARLNKASELENPETC